ncbi:MAG: cytidine/deoxycytidylate deaminase family protein [Candidatus Omnitrophica bacterium]|nr:cytidine/deoxycytidylate deaminase family protein [Candidatus Omnitrophota bacterium]
MKKKISFYQRPSWDEYFLQMAQLISKRSTCLRRFVGAIAVRDKRILATGYNGAPSGLVHCINIGCIRRKMKIPSGQRQELCRGLHAEQNVIIQAVIHKADLKDSILYVTNQPCVTCTKMLISVGVKEIVIREGYPDELAIRMLKEAKIKLRTVKIGAKRK